MAPTAVIDWPLSNERMPSPRHWKQVNAHYPGRWRAEIHHLVVGEDTVVTATKVSDGGPSVVAISFFTFEDGRITRLVEYWPETYAAPSWRAPWVTPIDTAGEPNT
jgi:ketosteroid isomerase-like protein